VLLSTGSATQAGAVQILVLIALLLSQTCGVAATIELVARGMIARDPTPLRSGHVRAGAGWVRDRVRFGRTR
jgi:putative ABC transport system permease protein